jgi:hypothetical protein
MQLNSKIREKDEEITTLKTKLEVMAADGHSPVARTGPGSSSVQVVTPIDTKKEACHTNDGPNVTPSVQYLKPHSDQGCQLTTTEEKDGNREEIAALNKKADMAMDFITNKIGTIIENRIKNALDKEDKTPNRHTEHVRYPPQRNERQENIAIRREDDYSTTYPENQSWRDVTSRRPTNRPNNIILGTRKNTQQELKVAEKLAWF